VKFKLVLVIKSVDISCTFYFETLLVVPEAEINANHALITSMTFMFLSVKQFIVQKQTKMSILYRDT